MADSPTLETGLALKLISDFHVIIMCLIGGRRARLGQVADLASHIHGLAPRCEAQAVTSLPIVESQNSFCRTNRGAPPSDQPPSRGAQRIIATPCGSPVRS